jgi:hypothetical protein
MRGTRDGREVTPAAVAARAGLGDLPQGSGTSVLRRGLHRHWADAVAGAILAVCGVIQLAASGQHVVARVAGLVAGLVVVGPPALRAGRRRRERRPRLSADAFGNRIAVAADEPDR